MKIGFLLLLLLFLFSQGGNGQTPFSVEGYLKDMHSFYRAKNSATIPSTEAPGHFDYNLLHNRFNVRYYTNNWFSAALDIRTRFFAGGFIKDFPAYANLIDTDKGVVDLSWNWLQGNGYFANTMIDRLYFDLNFEKWNVRIGRQRINWGINLVWNPNDLFNTFDYFDFDYEERPGTDAIKLTHYSDATSSAELVYRFAQDIVGRAIAGKYQFNYRNYDIQLIGGIVGYDWVLGGGWAGDIKGAGFRGEFSHFEPLRKYNAQSFSATVLSVSADYTFSNSLFVHSGILYNSHATPDTSGNQLFTKTNLSAKKLSFGHWSVFTQVSYPITPLLTADLSTIINPTDGSLYIGPSVAVSLFNNFDLNLIGQLFAGKEGSEYGQYGRAAFVRLKWSF